MTHYAINYEEFEDDNDETPAVYTDIDYEYAEWSELFVADNGEFALLSGREILQELT